MSDHTTQREPLLSGADMVEMYYANSKYGGVGASVDALNAVRDFYEAKITSWELRVVEEVELVYKEEHPTEWWCSICDWRGVPSHYAFCPGCGNKIKR